jgi:hypothetical protein
LSPLDQVRESTNSDDLHPVAEIKSVCSEPAEACNSKSGGVLRSEWIVGLLAALPALIVLSVFGPIDTPDSSGYVGFAEQILSGKVPTGSELLAEAAMPVSLFRTPGYPALIAVFQYLFGDGWKVALVLLQISVSSLLAIAVYRTAALLGLPRVLALLVSLLPSVSIGLVMEVSIMTDAIYSVLFGCAALFLLRAVLHTSSGTPLYVGLLLATAMSLREATFFIAAAFVPGVWIAAGPGRRVRWLSLSFLPLLAVTACLMTANFIRSGYAVVTTTPQIVMVQALLPLDRQGLPLFHDDTLFDRTARETLRGDDYKSISELNDKLFRAGLSAPQIAAEARHRYFRTWRRFPVAMLLASIGRYRERYLALPFHPLNAARLLLLYSGQPSPKISNPGSLWQDAQRGIGSAAFWLLVYGATRAIGTVIGVIAVAAPFFLLRKGDHRALALLSTWFICAGFIAIYMPVHLNERYLVPLIPLQCLLAGTFCAMLIDMRREQAPTVFAGARMHARVAGSDARTES